MWYASAMQEPRGPLSPSSLARRLELHAQIFMQSAGAKHYGKGKSYNFFLGKDATRAYVTGVVIPQSEPWVLPPRHLTLAYHWSFYGRLGTR
jgi:hypothetical protein